MRLRSSLLFAALLVACGGDDPEPAADAASDVADTQVDDTSADAGDDTSPDTTEDAGDDTSTDTEPDVADTGDDADLDAVADADAPDVPDFSDWDHMTPWEGPTADWGACGNTPDGTLANKAAYYDWIVPAIHQVPTDVPGHEDWSRVFRAECDAEVPTTIVEDDELPTCTHGFSENNGLWTSLYIASQAYRYAATGSDEALQQVLRTLRGTHRMMRITGTPGLFTRDFRDPSIPQQRCHDNPMQYRAPDENMVGNHWVRVRDNGCFETYDPELNEGSGDWVQDDEHCTSDEFAGFCWQRNGSKDELSGHMYAASVVAKLVDNEEAQTLAADILQQATQHLIDNEFWITDYDGRRTRFGSAHAMSLDHIPGFNALMAVSWTRAGLSVTGAEGFEDFYYGCLLAEYPVDDCIDAAFERGVDYRTYMTDFAMKVGCQTNYDNVNIGLLGYAGLMLMEPDPALRETYRTAFHRNTRGPDSDGRDLWSQRVPQFNFVVAALMGSEPENIDDAVSLVNDGICTLYEFHDDNRRHGIENPDVEVECVSDRHGNLAAEPRPIAERCMHVFEWWGDPAQIENCEEDLTVAEAPAAYLLPYWMGRYHGFISDDM